MISQAKTAAEFFAGIGLMRIGLENAGWNLAFANDIDRDKWEMYRDHFGSSDEFVLGDIHDLRPDQIPAVSLATASFPCNDLSLAGARQGLAGAHSSAFWGFVDILKTLKRERRPPPLVLLENVPGFLSSNDGRDFEDALLALNDLGYAVDTFIIDAARFVPQSRQRLFVVGMRTETVSILNDAPGFCESEARPSALASFILLHPDINWLIRRLPAFPKRAKCLKDIIEDLPLNHQMWWSRQRCDYMLSQMSPKHRAQAESMIRGEAISFGTVFRRVRNGKCMAELRTDGIAGCLRTPRGGSGRQILFAAGEGQYNVRLLTPRECARLMGADDFTVRVSLNQALFGFGDAVCVPVIEWIARNYLNPVWVEKYAKEEPSKFGETCIKYKARASRNGRLSRPSL
ncbi:MAG TPA: DNA (cytosine-5-)-methyltransferase [Verrucomicrobiae bacterium]|jgi:DNA (cytosine-5)-methyltransferase 1|nr:DNA (cytosine-5-)-methyltransferase [Verrucomicrobiae bacterium]